MIKDEFQSPSLGKVTFDRMFDALISFIEEEPDVDYNLIIGTDSLRGEDTCFVTAVVLHKVGHGGRYFYRRFYERGWKIESLRQRIYYETSLSLELASKITEALAVRGHADLPVEIHLDVGEAGETRNVIKEVVGMITGSGYNARVKPDSYGAGKVADRHTK